MKSTGSALQHLEAGVARADVVERELEAERAQPRGLGDQQLLARVGALGDLQHHLLGLVARAAHGEHEAVARQRVVLERLRRDVEEQQRARRQLARDAQRRAAADRVELVAAADRVGDLERLAGTGELRRARPRERLVAEHARAAEVPDRLEGDVDGARVDQRAHRAHLLDRDDRDAVDDLGGGDDRVAAAALGLEQRRVGTAPERAGLAVVGHARR